MTTVPFQPEQYRGYLRVLAHTLIQSDGLLRHKTDASDIVQETLFQAWKALPQFQGTSHGQFAAWLRAILASKLADAHRHFARGKRDVNLEQSYRETLDGSDARLHVVAGGNNPPSPSRRLDRMERSRHLAEALETLPDDQRAAAELRYLMDCPLEEIAARMERSRASVAGLLRRSLKTLRECLEDKEKDLF